MSELRRRLTPIEVDRLKVKLYEGFHESHEGLLEKNPKRYYREAREKVEKELRRLQISEY